MEYLCTFGVHVHLHTIRHIIPSVDMGIQKAIFENQSRKTRLIDHMFTASGFMNLKVACLLHFTYSCNLTQFDMASIKDVIFNVGV